MGTSALQEWIGRTTEAEDIITPRLIASFQATLTSHLAASTDAAAPLGLHWCMAPDIVETEGLGQDGHPAKGRILPPVPQPRRMWAGGELTLFAPMRVHDRVLRRSTIEEITEKQGKSGPLCFVTVRHDLENQAGPVICERQVIVYRSPSALDRTPARSADHQPSRSSQHVKEIQIDPVLLFRYSALTFNGHRIHYDTPYAIEIERYEGLVIHGPLQATLLLNLASAVTGRAPRSFSFRAVLPAVGCHTLRTCASSVQNDSLTLSIEREDGHVAMTATARW